MRRPRAGRTAVEAMEKEGPGWVRVNLHLTGNASTKA